MRTDQRRPWLSITILSWVQATPASGSSPQPCRSASSIASAVLARAVRALLLWGDGASASHVPCKPLAAAQSRATSSFKPVMRGMFGALPVPKRSAQLTRIW
jgi:hypothetical protein